jgi:PAS domain S-box-containing protein
MKRAWYRAWSLLDSLERRVTLSVTLLLVVVIGGMFWLSRSRVVDAVSSAEMSRLKTSAGQLGQTLTAQATRLTEEIGGIAAAPGLRGALSAGASQSAVDLAASTLDASVRGTTIHDVALLNINGDVIATAGGPGARLSKPDRASRFETVTGPTIGPLMARGDTVAYAITAPVAGLGGAPIGYVVATRLLTGGAESATLLGGLVGRGARVLMANADGSLTTDLTKPVTRSEYPGSSGSAATYMDADGRIVLGASAPITGTPWMVIVEAPRVEALQAAHRFTRDSGIAGAIFIVLGALLSGLLIRRAMRPLGEVTAAAREIAAGDMSRRAVVRGRSEIAVLGEAFNRMVERVGRSAHDLTSRANQLEASNKELNESEAKYRSLFEHLPDGIVVHHDDQILFANPAARRLLGVATDTDLANRSMMDFIAPFDRGTVRDVIEQITAKAQPLPTMEVRLQRADRRIATVEATSMPLRVNGSAAVQTVLHDVTERRLLEEQFRQSQKMDAVGRLAGGVAHDFNNLLTVIQAHAEFALSPTGTDDERRRDIEEIRRTADAAARLTRQLLTFSRKQSVTPTQIDLNESISGMLGMLQRLIGDNIEVVIVGGDQLAGIWADEGQIQQVLLNLAVNARDAMPEGGVLRFETANITVGDGYVGAASVAIPPGDYVMLAVQDTGIGMTEEIRSRVFEPFFTTKQAGRGTGLGLSTVYGIVKQAGGHIWVYSEPGMGTAFKVFFPPHSSGEAAPPVLAVADGTGERQGHLVVVEDDASVRTAVVRTLRGAGYSVREAANAEAALGLLNTADPIDLLITDLIMPGMPGVELLDLARSLRPGLPAIVLSGYSEQPGARVGRLPDQALFIEKPVSPAELIRRVTQLLTAAN